MKKLLYIVLAGLLLFVPAAFAAHNSSHYNETVNKFELPGPGSTLVCYYGTTTTTSVAGTDSVGTFYTKAMWIPDLTGSDCYFRMVMYNSARGTEDCDVYVLYSTPEDLAYGDFYVGSASSGKIKDQLSTTAVQDTLNVLVGTRDANYAGGAWMQLKFSMQAGNPVGTYVKWYLFFQKNTLTPGRVARVANTTEP